MVKVSVVTLVSVPLNLQLNEAEGVEFAEQDRDTGFPKSPTSGPLIETFSGPSRTNTRDSLSEGQTEH